MKPLRHGVCCLAIASLTLPAGAQQNAWAIADSATVRLQPSTFATMPATVRGELERRACTIPQPYASARPVGVESGNFVSEERPDWVVLCSIARESSILVFVGGRPDSVLVLASSPDKAYLQGVGDGKIGFSRVVTRIPVSRMARYLGRACGGQPRRDGIADEFLEKGSTIFYWCDGKWLRLAGAD